MTTNASADGGLNQNASSLNDLAGTNAVDPTAGGALDPNAVDSTGSRVFDPTQGNVDPTSTVNAANGLLDPNAATVAASSDAALQPGECGCSVSADVSQYVG